MAGTYYGSAPPGVAGAYYGSDPFGVRGGDLPASGLHGPAINYADVVRPDELEDLFRCTIVTIPGGLTFFFVDEYGRLQAEGPDGIYTGLREGYKNGTSYGQASFTLYIGTSPVSLSGAVQLADVLPAGGIVADSGRLQGAVQLADVLPAGSLAMAPTVLLSGAVQLADVGVAGELSGLVVRYGKHTRANNLSTGARPDNLN